MRDFLRKGRDKPQVTPLAKIILGKAHHMNGKNRTDIKPGIQVRVIQKQDQKTGKLTTGVVKDLLTKSSNHPHGIKVRLEGGIVGRVKEIL